MKNLRIYPTLEYQDLLKILSGLVNVNEGICLHNLVMVGGVHASGKSSLCERLSLFSQDITLVMASKLVNHFSASKFVNDIKSNQLTLIEKISEIKKNNCLTIVDGHFCVPDINGKIRYVGNKIFQILSPELLILVEADPIEIQQRIQHRDHIKYSLELIETMMQAEACWADYTSTTFDIPLYRIKG